MTVSDLIDYLQQFPKDAPVVLHRAQGQGDFIALDVLDYGTAVVRVKDEDDVQCAYCDSRNVLHLDGKVWDCNDCGETFEVEVTK